MKEFLIFLIIFLIIFSISVFIFNGRFIYSQAKYSVIGSEPVTPFSKFLDSGERDVSLKLVIPDIGVEAPIILSETSDESLIQENLKNGVVRYLDSNVILGHSSAYPWYKGSYGSIFSLLNKLELGNQIHIYSGGNKFSYEVINKQIDFPKNFDLEKDDSIIYLVSCWPISTNWKRIVIMAKSID